MKIQYKRIKAFTLIELLVVVAIIGVLATIVIINVTHAQNKSHYARVVGDMTQIATAVKAYEVSNNNIYPPARSAPEESIDPLLIGAYLGASWPTTPCGSNYNYSYYNFNDPVFGVCSIDGNPNKEIGIVLTKNTPNSYLYYYNIKNFDSCAVTYGPLGEIRSLSTKEITCNE